MNAFDVLVSRGFVQQHTEGAPALLAAEKTSFYVGFDPTGDSLHVGHLLPVMAMAHLQRAGHFPIAVVGGGTGMVGDPSGKDEARQLLTREQVQLNMAGLREQIGRVLDLSPGKGLMVDNGDWLLGLNYIEFLRDIGRHFSVNTMLGKASVQLRLEKGLSFIEFNYQLLQAYDFLHLFQNHGCKLQMGGDDQWGNITAGTDLIRRVTGKEAQGLTFPLLTTASGAKMGKTAKGAVWLSEARLPVYDYFQYWVNVDDRDVGKLLRIFTFLPLERIVELENLEGSEIREAKRVLALEATAVVHGREKAEAAEAQAREAFSGEGAGKEVPLPMPLPLRQALVKAGLCASGGEADRLIRQGGVRVGERAASDPHELISEAVVLWKGKKVSARVVPG